MKLKRWAVAALSLWMAAAGRAGGLPDGSPEQERGLLVRVGAGLASANLEGTGESCWRRPKDKGERGFQYSVDVADWRRNWGYGLTFKHYTNGSAFAGSGGETADEHVRILYAAPQLSYVEEGLIFKKMVFNADLGIGYAHYRSKGDIGGARSYKVPKSGMGTNVNLGFSYFFTRHVSARISLAVEYYLFKNLHEAAGGCPPDAPCDMRSRLGIVMTVTQLGLAYSF